MAGPSTVPAKETPLRAVTFDAGGTLIKPWPSVGHVYAEVIREKGFGDLDPSTLDQRFHEAWMQRHAFDYSKAAWSRLVARALNPLTSQASDPRLFEALWHRFALASAWHVFEDVFPCLKALKEAGMRLAVVSNWDERLHDVLRVTGLSTHFEYVLPSIEGSAPKPDPRLFLQAARRLQLPPESIVHVGDSEVEDGQGARSAGFRAVILQRKGSLQSPEQIATLADLPSHLGFR